MARFLLLSLPLVLLVACVLEAPSELEGLWSRSDGACAMGAGVRFEADAVRVFLGRDEEVLLEAPQYRVERRGALARITIDYLAPGRGDGVSGEERRGVLILERDAASSLRAVSHQFADKSTGAVSVRLGEEDPSRYFALHRCGGAPAAR